jgi:NhaP-type Na+/H+ or K+/H+ antiporter
MSRELDLSLPPNSIKSNFSVEIFLDGVDTTSLITFVLFLGLTIGGLIREVNKKTGIPYTPMLFVLGLFVGLFSKSFGVLGVGINLITNIDPHSILMIFLPILIFESGFNADMHYFK